MQLTDLLPTVVVFGAAHDEDAMPESASEAFGVAVAELFKKTGFGATVGFKVGAVASRLTVTLWEFVPPALEAAARIFVHEQPALTGQRLGNYQMLEKLGAGGMGEVYLANIRG